MRIALVQDYLRMGGTETQTVALARAFAGAAHRVLIVTFRPGGALEAEIPENVHRVSLQRRDWRLDWFAPGLVEVLQAFNPDIVQLMGRMANCHGARVIPALGSARVVATFRTGKSIPWLFGRTLTTAAAVVANSDEAAGRAVRDHGVESSRITVIRNALARETEAELPTRAEIRRSVGTPPHAVVFLCTAMMRPGKGHRELVDALARTRIDSPAELWLAGDGIERRRTKQLAEKRKLAGRVRFLGQRRDVAALYEAADVAVLASRLESLPNFLVEAQWHGLPVIACDTAGVCETFVPGESGFLLRHEKPDDFARKMEQLARDGDLRTRMSEAARRHARAEFDPARQNQKYLELFEQLVSTGS